MARIYIERFPMPDTGLGREAGYENDEALIAAAEAQRAALPDDVRAKLDDIDRAFVRAVVFGSDV